MKAITIESCGDPVDLRRRALATPEPGEARLLVQVVAAGVSRADLEACRGRLGDAPDGLPWVPGFEIAGRVERLGAGATRFRVGDKVWALLPAGGGYAQYALVEERHAAPLPASSLFEEAAALPLDGVAAWRALRAVRKRVEAGATVVVDHAASGAGHLAAQLALAAGARVAATGPETQRDFVERLGGIEWVGERDVEGERVILSAGAAPPDAGGVDLTGGPASLQAVTLREGIPPEAVAELGERISQRRLRPQMSRILDLARAAEAQNSLDDPACCGKLALSL